MTLDAGKERKLGDPNPIDTGGLWRNRRSDESFEELLEELAPDEDSESDPLDFEFDEDAEKLELD